ncbi:aspartate aminotransferase family protein [Marinomonas epiphytica]
MTHIFQRHCHANLPTAIRGEGSFIYDQTGKSYLDASGGAAVSCLGHNHPQIQQALHKQIDQLSYAHSGFFHTEASEQLANKLAELAPGDLNHVYLVSGGSEAVESALKLARQYFVERGELERKTFISRRQSYHGNTLGALAVGGNALRRAPFDPLLMPVEHISPCFAFHGLEQGESHFEYGQRMANELEQRLLKVGPESVIGFIAEPVVGATAGAVTAEAGYFKRVREICDQYGVLLILDEVMCGMGRTGSIFAQQQEGIVADIVTIAKGLGAGYQPIGAMIASSQIHQTIEHGSGFFQHGHTYMGHAVAAAGSVAVLDILQQPQTMQLVQESGQLLQKALSSCLSGSEFVADIRGRGLFQAIELMQDRGKNTPFPKASRLEAKIKAHAMSLGLMCYPMSGTIDGEQGHHVLLAPPFIIKPDEIMYLAETLATSIEAVCQKEYLV